MAERSGIDLIYAAGHKTYRGQLLEPAMPAKAAIVMLPDWQGQSELALAHAQHWIDLGYLVAIADLYGDGFSPDRPEQVGPMVQRLVENRSEGVDMLAACVNRLRKMHPDIPVVCLGYSAGGMIALDYGRSGGDVAGIVLCTALLKTAAHGMGSRISAPVLVIQGTQDQISPMEVIATVIAEMDHAGNDVRFELHTQTHHGFDNPAVGRDPGGRLVYSSVATDRAQVSIAAFLLEVHTVK